MGVRFVRSAVSTPWISDARWTAPCGSNYRHRRRPGQAQEDLRPAGAVPRAWRVAPDAVDLCQRLDMDVEPRTITVHCHQASSFDAGGHQPSGHLCLRRVWPGPKDIPVSVMEASAAASAASQQPDRGARGSTEVRRRRSRPWNARISAAKRPASASGSATAASISAVSSGRAGSGGIRQNSLAITWTYVGEQHVQLRPGYPGQDGRSVIAEHKLEPGGGGGLHPTHPRAPVSGDSGQRWG